MFTSDLIASLDVRSKNRLAQFRTNLKRDWDRRNYDFDLVPVIVRYLKQSQIAEFNRTDRYLKTLRSSVDGKFFSQGVKEYSLLLEGGKKFSESNHTYFGWNQNYKAALNQMMAEAKQFSLDPLEYRSDADISEALPRKDTHAGFTYIETGVKEKGGNLDDILRKFQRMRVKALKHGSFFRPILPAVRTQGTGNAFEEDGSFTHDCKHKTRLVSIVDMYVIIAELIFAKPFQQRLAREKWYAGGKELNWDVGNIIANMRHHYHHWVSLDYSSYDQSISAWLIHDAFKIIRCSFRELTSDHQKLLDVLEHDFIEKEFIFGDEIILSNKGVPSGSMWTQIVDSIVNKLMILTYLNAKKLTGDMIIMGDDNLLYTTYPLDVKDLSSYLSKNFGVQVNALKSKSGTTRDDPHFLSVDWRHSGRWREVHQVFSKMLYPERKRVYSPGGASPIEVLWAYILAYPASMEAILDMRKFEFDNPNLTKKHLKEMGSSYVPGVIKYLKNYSYGYWSA